MYTKMSRSAHFCIHYIILLNNDFDEGFFANF